MKQSNLFAITIRQYVLPDSPDIELPIYSLISRRFAVSTNTFLFRRHFVKTSLIAYDYDMTTITTVPLILRLFRLSVMA